MSAPATRRAFLRTSLAAAGAAMLAHPEAEVLASCLHLPRTQPRCPDPFARGRFVGTIPFADGGVPFAKGLGVGLDARLYTDLSTLTPDTLVTPNDRFFIRTSAPDPLVSSDQWTIEIRGLVKEPIVLTLAELKQLIRPFGPYLVECAGNPSTGSFGLMSAARWGGVPMADVLARAGILPRATRVLIAGFDHHPAPSRSSTPGASWIFTLSQLAEAGAFLATEMNGFPLSKDHGFPIRLIVPRWYGCANIKWVNEIVLVDDTALATEHMKEFARRTHQERTPTLAKNFKPASIDQAAMPVRVEKWLVDGKITYRVIGIMWGGSRPTDALAIRFHPREHFTRVEVCPPQATNDTWTLWSHAWRPASPSRYGIVLKVLNPAIPTRRLDLYFYARPIWVEEVS